MNRYIIASAIVLGSLSFQHVNAVGNPMMTNGKMDKQKMVGLSMVAPQMMEKNEAPKEEMQTKMDLQKDILVKKEQDVGMPIATGITESQQKLEHKLHAIK